jgi:murein DD-endopeptidase MepM/ murein hydrolase activator NlpD
MIRHYWPVPGAKLRTKWADFLVWRDPTEHTKAHTLHGGIDLSLGDNMPHQVISAAPGKVVDSRTATSYNPGVIVIAGITIFRGKLTILYLVYGHMSPKSVRANPVGKMVAAGESLGTYASTDDIAKYAITNKTNPEMGAHLHFEVRTCLYGKLGTDKIATNFDPISFLNAGKLVFGNVEREKYPVQGW